MLWRHSVLWHIHYGFKTDSQTPVQTLSIYLLLFLRTKLSKQAAFTTNEGVGTG